MDPVLSLAIGRSRHKNSLCWSPRVFCSASREEALQLVEQADRESFAEWRMNRRLNYYSSRRLSSRKKVRG
ncbi:hypothetical protein TNCV_4312741 [Trichonephila clavipes]|nr:hypothetical protein TNCV_4312741 [Trichonephila clavipes]